MEKLRDYLAQNELRKSAGKSPRKSKSATAAATTTSPDDPTYNPSWTRWLALKRTEAANLAPTIVGALIGYSIAFVVRIWHIHVSFVSLYTTIVCYSTNWLMFS